MDGKMHVKVSHKSESDYIFSLALQIIEWERNNASF